MTSFSMNKMLVPLLSTLLGFLSGQLFLSTSNSSTPSLDSTVNFSKKEPFAQVLTFPEESLPPLTDHKNTIKAWNWVQVEQEMERLSKQKKKRQGLLYIVTPTVRSPVQVPNLVRTAQSFYPFRKLIRWLIFEDSGKTKAQYPNHVSFLLQELKDFAPKLDFSIEWSQVRNKNEEYINNPKGVEGRRDGMAWVRKHSDRKGVIFFADDDNTYDSDLFRQILTLTKPSFSAWPVGLVTPNFKLSSPVLNKAGVAFDIHDGWKVNREFPLDFAGFAISARLIVDKPDVTIPYITSYEESYFIKDLGITLAEIKPLGNNATEVLASHSKSEHVAYMINDVPAHEASNLKKLKQLKNTNIPKLYKKYDFIRVYA